MDNPIIHPYDEQYSIDDLREGRVPEYSLYSVIVKMGKANMREAEPYIEPFLTSPDPNLRSAALFTLALWWKLPQHRQTALDFLAHDDFELNRASAANYLGAYYRDTSDPIILATLAKVVLNLNENVYVRRSAYTAMRGIIHYDPREFWRMNRIPPDQFAEMVDWDFVRAHAG